MLLLRSAGKREIRLFPFQMMINEGHNNPQTDFHGH